MNHLYEELARSHQQDLLDEAGRRGQAGAARAARSPREAAAGASSLRRQLGWAVIGLGTWLAGGGIDSPVASPVASPGAPRH